MNWAEISVAVGVISVLFGWLKMDSVRSATQILELEKKVITLETIIKMMRKEI